MQQFDANSPSNSQPNSQPNSLPSDYPSVEASDLSNLHFSAPLLEKLSGLEVSSLCVGGVFTGVWRPSLWRSPLKVSQWAGVQLMGAILLLVLGLPLGLWVARTPLSAGDQPAIARRFFPTAFGWTALAWLGWNGSMLRRQRHRRRLLDLIDQIDRFEQLVSAIILVQKLQALEGQGSPEALPALPADLLQALTLTRENLIAGLKRDRLTREHPHLAGGFPQVRAPGQALGQTLALQIEQNLVQLQSLHLPASDSDLPLDYTQLLQDAVDISTSVSDALRTDG
jgi:hypothetical protein